MLRKDIERGTLIFSKSQGVGIFFGNYDNDLVKINFINNGKLKASISDRKYLTEIDYDSDIYKPHDILEKKHRQDNIIMNIEKLKDETTEFTELNDEEILNLVKDCFKHRTLVKTGDTLDVTVKDVEEVTKMKQKVIIIEEDQNIYEEEIEESEIPALLDGGFVTAILRNVEEGIEYAKINYITKDINNIITTRPEVEWKIPQKKEE